VEIIKHLPETIAYLENEPMSQHTTFRTGGPADIMLIPSNEQELSQSLKTLFELGIKPIIIGNGSNLVVSDKGIRGVVIKISDKFAWTKVSGDIIECGAGISLFKLCNIAAENSLSGGECLFGIPGTVGGAVYMNAGAYGSETKDILQKVTYMELDGTVGELVGTDGYSYRCSPFSGSERIIIGAQFKFNYGKKSEIEEKMKEIKARRVEKQPLNFPSAGSAFKRPEGYFAAALIEQAGLKGFTVGGAQISEKHAGFIVNINKATTADIKAVISSVKEKVFNMFGVLLEPEVKFIGEE